MRENMIKRIRGGKFLYEGVGGLAKSRPKFGLYDCLKNWTRDKLLVIYSLLLYQVQVTACVSVALKTKAEK